MRGVMSPRRKLESAPFLLDRRSMKIRLVLLLTLIFAVASAAPSFAAGDRYALVIGNAKYPDADAPLKEPINDARDVADELKRDGFNVDVQENLNGDGMRRAFDKLYGKLKPGSIALIFFSGFGVQSNRQSYMIPIDAQIWTEADVRRDGFSLETVVGDFRQWRRPQPIRAGASEGNSRSRPDGRRNAQPDPRRRDPRLAQRAGAVDFVVVGGGLLLHPGLGRQPTVHVGTGRDIAASRSTPAAAAQQSGAAPGCRNPTAAAAHSAACGGPVSAAAG